MGHKSKISLVQQVKTILDGKLAIGQSKHLAKKDGSYHDHIYSWSTYRSYMQQCCRFVKWCRVNYHCKTLDECRTHVDDYVMEETHTKSAWTIKLEASALAKLYGCRTTDFIETPSRRKPDIVRSRGSKSRDRHFSAVKNAELISFCRSTGLRRHELEKLKGTDLKYEDGRYFVCVKGKGGRYREALVIGNVNLVVDKMEQAGNEKVFPKVHSAADIHGYRADYASAVYRMHARDYQTCINTKFYNPEHYNGKGRPKGGFDRDSVYRFKGDDRGKWLDKRAMLIASQMLGHNRISVTTFYLR